MKNKKGGYEYYLSEEKIKEYSKWPIERRLRRLSQFNKLRKYYPEETIDMFKICVELMNSVCRNQI